MHKLAFVFACLAVCATTSAQKLTHSQALSRIQAAGIGISSSGGCSDRNTPTCTSLDQVNENTIASAIVLRSASGCPMTITGGTETGHASGTYSHWNGYKLDYSLNSCLENYVRTHYTYIGVRPDGYQQWQSAAGNIYCLEGNHWDVTYY